MTLIDCIRTLGQSVAFSGKGPDEATLAGLLEAVRFAPSTGNLQPWEVVVVRSLDVKGELVDTTLDPFFRDDPSLRPAWIKDAPAVLVFCADVKRVKARYGADRAFAIASRDVAAAEIAFRLAALEAGVQTGVVLEFDAAKVRRALAIPSGVEPLSMVAVGFARGSSDAEYRPTLPVGEFVHFERW